MSHDAATGYISTQSISKTSLSWPYSKTQVGSIYRQLNDGARALDLRPKLLLNGTIIMQHGSISIPVTMDTIVKSAMDWCRDNPSELVLLMTSHFEYASSSVSSDNGNQRSMTSALASLYQEYGVSYVACNDLYGLTMGNVMELALLAEDGGYLLAMDAHDFYGTSCSKENWVPSQIVTCWDKKSDGSSRNPSATASCHTSEQPWTRLQDYMLASANNPATDSRYTLGPPATLTTTPLNQVQAFWQVNGRAVARGLLHASSILQDNQLSRVNERVVELVYSGSMQSIGLLAVDNVALHGNALLSVLRTACGQSDDLTECGPQFPMPRMKQFRLSIEQLCVALLITYGVAWLCWLLYRRPNVMTSLCARLTRGKLRFSHAKQSDRCEALFIDNDKDDARGSDMAAR